MKLGEISAQVKIVQGLVNSQFKKSSLKIDGHFGPKTKHYVQQFQIAAGLEADGVVGPITMAALKSLHLNLDETVRTAPKPVSKDPIKVPIPGLLYPATGEYPPFAIVAEQKMPERGEYKGGIKGAVVHFTAGHDGALKTILGGIKNKYTFWCLQRDGKLFCAHRARFWGYHAGESKWKNLVGGVSDDLLGIEINAYGSVKPVKGKPGRYVTYFGLEVGEDVVRYSAGKDNQAKGYYHVYTRAQEITLVETLVWLAMRFPASFSVDNILGHDEVSGMKGIGRWRKTDPGAALSMTMSELRELVRQTVYERRAAKV